MGAWGSSSVETGHAYMATTLKPGLGPSAVQVGCSGKPSTLEGDPGGSDIPGCWQLHVQF